MSTTLLYNFRAVVIKSSVNRAKQNIFQNIFQDNLGIKNKGIIENLIFIEISYLICVE